jgi:hypothetical protein
VVSEVAHLSRQKGAYIVRDRNPKKLKLLRICPRRDEDITVIIERDVATFEEVIDVWGEQKPIAAVETLLVCPARSPWLYMPRIKQSRIAYP